MDKLLTPDLGVTFWTIINFLLLVFVLGKFAWKPMLNMINAREEKIAQDKQQAEDARAAAQKIKDELQTRLKNIAAEAEAKMASSRALSMAERDNIIKEAKESAANILKQTKAELESEKAKAVSDAKKEIVSISIMAAEKALSAANTPASDARLIENAVNEIQKEGHG
jgi:F-type H+-transporting ATPase subunit b